MTATLGLAFVAGILTVAAPCVLPLLPVAVGGAVVSGDVVPGGDERRARWRPFGIAGSLVVSVVLFTLLLKATTALLGVPPLVWQVVSGGIIVLLGIDMVFPALWDRLSSALRLQSRSGDMLDRSMKRRGVGGDILTGRRWGRCSPVAVPRMP